MVAPLSRPFVELKEGLDLKEYYPREPVLNRYGPGLPTEAIHNGEPVSVALPSSMLERAADIHMEDLPWVAPPGQFSGVRRLLKLCSSTSLAEDPI